MHTAIEHPAPEPGERSGACPAPARLSPLIWLNILLLVVLALVTIAPGAEARQGVRSRAPGQYAIVSGRFQGSTDRALFIADVANEELVVLRWDRSRRVLEGIGYRDLAADAAGARRQGR